VNLRFRLHPAAAPASLRAPLTGTLLGLIAVASSFYTSPSLQAESITKPWQGVDPGVRGSNETITLFVNIGHGSSGHQQCYDNVYVYEHFFWARGYTAIGGYHVEDSFRDPELDDDPNYIACNGPYDGYWQPLAYAGFKQTNGQYKCSQPNSDCYVTTKWSWQDPGSRLFYTSDDGNHSTVQCWDSGDPDDCAGM
jgi:hypothetical protein